MLSKNILQRCTGNTKRIIENAFKIASTLKENEVKAEHLLIGIWQEKGSLGMALLQLYNFQNKSTSKLITGYLENSSARSRSASSQHIQLSETAKKILKKAAVVASQYSHKYIGTEHILYSILDSRDEKVDHIFHHAKIDKKQMKKSLQEILRDTSLFPDPMSVFSVTSTKGQESKKLQKSFLSHFCTNLTQLANQGKIEPIIGREEEIDRVIHIINRKTKNNPILIGEPGVGKTAIIQGLALKIAKGEAPESLKNTQILSLDLSAVVAGTMLRGDLEARIKEIIEETKQIKNLILFIDEIHNLVGAGSATGTMDTANILKPSLSQGEIQCIGATTLDEYRRFIEKDRALERRFQPVIVKEISPEQTIKVIKGLRPTYEQYHNIKITDESIKAAVHLSGRYINDRYLPDKAIDVIDETASRLRSTKYIPDPAQRRIHLLKNKLTELESAKAQLVLKEDYQSAITFKEKQEKLIGQLSILQVKRPQTIRSLQISEKDIRETIATMTGVPIDEVRDINNIKRLEKIFTTKIIGQDHAIKTVCGFIKRANAGITSPDRPWGSFLFLGPTGVGKTEFAKVLAEELFGVKEAFIKLDMSEFMEKHNVARLVGSPPGYVGYEEGGKLTERIRRNPYSLILLDEIEKAHPDVFNLLLQILEDGVLTDARGTQVNFRNTIIIMTSNIGTEAFSREASKLGFTAPELEKNPKLEKRYEAIKENALQELKSHMRPELLNRIDQILVFKPLGLNEIEKITSSELKKLTARLKHVRLTITQDAKKIIVEKSFNIREGARLVRRQIQELIEEPIADSILESHPKHVEVKTRNGKIIAVPKKI